MKSDKPAFEAFRALTDADAAAVNRISGRLADRAAPRPIVGWSLAAAALLGAVLLGWDRQPVATPAASPMHPLAITLAAQGELTPDPRFAVRWQGRGEISGAPEAPQVTWYEGSITVSVEPNRGTALSVVTDEAVVSVRGTQFTVTRSPLGTSVIVDHGVVAVACSDGSTHELGAAAEAECLPTRAAALLRRARALPPDRADLALRDVERAMRDPEKPAFLDDELHALHIALLARTGQRRAALDEALVYVRAAGVRTQEVAELARSLAPDAAETAILETGLLTARPDGNE